MTQIHATDRDGSKHELAGRAGSSLMEILRDGGLAIEALCGGSCQCATCHVFIEEPWLTALQPPTDFEAAALEDQGSEMQANSRLACQIPWMAELDGIVLTVAAEA
ncbi:MAG: 2Fe-2S iron-sulfur cluster binding domain-containing protein [Gammaproteobacteria bacterium]|nr:2Fe-2S iron-sulfur cluster binding domain-containing protein [Gammaproteobacteria bacterium]